MPVLHWEMGEVMFSFQSRIDLSGNVLDIDN